MGRNSRAFTLVELLVVIGIIALLVGIAVPSLRNAKALADRAGCRAHLHGIALGLHTYLSESDNRMPYAAQMPSISERAGIHDVLARQIEAPELFRCPADPDGKWFEREGTSYEYHMMLGGREVAETFLSERFGEAKVWVLKDFEPVHGRAGRPGACSYLFGDGHVGNLE